MYIVVVVILIGADGIINPCHLV